MTIQHPLATNFKKLLQYDFEVTKIDEVIFFEWLIVKQKSFGDGNAFYYQNRRATKELGIKRNRLNSIKLKFLEYGLGIKCAGLLNTTHYLVNDDFIKQFIYNHVKHNKQDKMIKNIRLLNFKGESNIAPEDKEAVIQLIQSLNEICENRKKYHTNYGHIEDSPSKVELPYNGKTIYQLSLLYNRYNNEVIFQTFEAYIDAMLLEKDFTMHYLNNFSSYDDHMDGFPVFDHYDRLVNHQNLPF